VGEEVEGQLVAEDRRRAAGGHRHDLPRLLEHLLEPRLPLHRGRLDQRRHRLLDADGAQRPEDVREEDHRRVRREDDGAALGGRAVDPGDDRDAVLGGGVERQDDGGDAGGAVGQEPPGRRRRAAEERHVDAVERLRVPGLDERRLAGRFGERADLLGVVGEEAHLDGGQLRAGRERLAQLLAEEAGGVNDGAAHQGSGGGGRAGASAASAGAKVGGAGRRRSLPAR
jgi:hypothetical protein